MSLANRLRRFLFFIISVLCFLSFLHRKIKWSVVWSSASAHGHVGLSVIPNLWKYDLNFPCLVTIDVNSGDTGSSCRSSFLAKVKKDLVTAPFSVLVHCCCHCLSPFSLTLVTITSLGIVSYITGSSSTPHGWPFALKHVGATKIKVS